MKGKIVPFTLLLVVMVIGIMQVSAQDPGPRNISQLPLEIPASDDWEFYQTEELVWYNDKFHFGFVGVSEKFGIEVMFYIVSEEATATPTLTPSPSATSVTGRAARVNVLRGVNIRTGPGLSYQIRTALGYGIEVTVISGPESADGHTWIELRSSTSNGWSIESAFEYMSTATPSVTWTPTNTPTPSSTSTASRTPTITPTPSMTSTLLPGEAASFRTDDYVAFKTDNVLFLIDPEGTTQQRFSPLRVSDIGRIQGDWDPSVGSAIGDNILVGDTIWWSVSVYRNGVRAVGWVDQRDITPFSIPNPTRTPVFVTNTPGPTPTAEG